MSKKHKVTNEIPEGFLERLKLIVGSSDFFRIEKTFAERLTTFRVNTLKWKLGNNETRKLLADKGFQVRQVPWYKDAFILLNKSKRELTELDIYKNGEIYIQSLASMVPPLVLDPRPGDRVLDLTAAPGSKTSQMTALMEQTGELVANDSNKVRFFKLKHNMEMLGVVDEKSDWKFSLRLEDGSRLCGESTDYFDKILVDAPCSAEARFISGEPKSYGYWNEKKIKEMAYKQRKLLFSAWHALRPGGTLVYSTCTFAPEENESQISKLLERFPDEVEMIDVHIEGLKTLKPLKSWAPHDKSDTEGGEKQFNVGVQKTVRILPTNEIEGFFVAKLRKKSV